jgi:hypothetical protein
VSSNPSYVERPLDADVDEEEDDMNPEELEEPQTGNTPDSMIDGMDDNELEKTIQSIGITASWESLGVKKKQLDATIKLFINARWLRGRKRCHRFLINDYFGNLTLCKCTPFSHTKMSPF